MNRKYITLYFMWFHLYNVLEKAKIWRQKSDQTLPEAGNDGRGLIIQGHEETFQSDWNILHNDYGDGYMTCGLMKTHRIIYQKQNKTKNPHTFYSL